VSAVAGTGASSFAPTALSGCVWWLRADQGTNTTVNGAAVTAWNEMSGSGDTSRNLAQGTTVNQPTYVASDTAFSGQPTILFVFGAHTQFLVNAAAWNATYVQPWSVFLVGRNNVAGSNQYFITKNSGTPRADIYDGGASDVLGATGVTDTILTTASVTNASVFGVAWNGTSSNVYVNALTPTSTGNLDAASLGDAAMCVGTYRSTDNNYGLLAGRVAEIVAYNRTLAPGELTNLFAYFRARYGIAIGP
jgi:hypothetical protein